ncbi:MULTISPECIES: hypothetical protein [unclassified Mesorhizobium]|uniref:hypothetical protein n=1 Tax=unclassified Mesorhizobium TaxID=325217 RepID=UPI0016742DEB|nr:MULTISPECIES: hypothetical protein [unclassified Mesorhizobium]
MQRNKVHHVSTVEHVARDLGVSEALIQDLTLGLEPEDGVISRSGYQSKQLRAGV